MQSLNTLFYIDNLSLIMMALVGFVAATVASFSSRYLQGDRKQGAFYKYLITLVACIFVMVCADHILVFYGSWALSNLILTRLMIHKREWNAALQSSRLTLRNFSFGLLFVGCAFALLYSQTGQTSIRAMIKAASSNNVTLLSCALLLLGAMTQSALFPFHRWLISSLNSPTPVSAIMHAGLVNGGGFLLARFAPMFAEQPVILNIMFAIGIITALLGTLWKLMQSDVKRMLACSTMGQMGFMIAQCGLGLFPAAVAHLCWHGLFKAYLFFASGGAAQERRLDLQYPPSLLHVLLALGCGALGAVAFAFVSGKALFTADTNLFLTLIACIAASQFALPVIRSGSLARLPIAVIVTLFAGAAYGGSVHSVEALLQPLGIEYAQPLNALHYAAFILLSAGWLAITFWRHDDNIAYPQWAVKLYVNMLNASQPYSSTVTAHRNHYQY